MHDPTVSHRPPRRAADPPPVTDDVAAPTVDERLRLGVWRFLRFLGASPDLADDLAQETFARLVERPPEDRGRAALGAWLRTVARSRFADSGRQPRRGIVLADQDAVERAWQRNAGDDEGETRLRALAVCVEGLTRRERAALTARFGAGDSLEDVASRIGCGIEGVRSIVRRAKARLRACIERRIGG